MNSAVHAKAQGLQVGDEPPAGGLDVTFVGGVRPELALSRALLPGRCRGTTFRTAGLSRPARDVVASLTFFAFPRQGLNLQLAGLDRHTPSLDAPTKAPCELPPGPGLRG
jgi:hypothetical protein